VARDRFLDIAITGISARFPGCTGIDAWWSALTAGHVLTTRYDRRALIDAGVPESLLDDPSYVPVGGHLSGADRFDNTFFRVSPRDAELMDPQHRLMLEVVWSALEDAGTGSLSGALVTGVYASASGSGYLRSMLAGGALDPLTLDQALHGTEPDFMASRIAYKLDLTGPAMGVQTACSSSLVGVHLAIQALLNGDCDQAVVVAAGIDFPQAGHLHVAGGIQSSSGSCRPFDEHADGVVAGSGVACVVLRRLADALADGPEAYGVILGTAVNNDGAAKAGYYAPSGAGQEAVIRAALHAANVDARSIGYLEAHATGTRIGDPIEWSAASAALSGMGAPPGQVAVGALKANIGHLDAAAGLASLIKALLVVKEGVVPPVAGFTRLNPLLEADGSPLFVPTKVGAWTGPEPRRAGISSFGIGGTNVHVIIEKAPDRSVVRRSGADGVKLVLLSAADPEALSRSAARLRGHLAASSPDLVDVSFTLAAGRAALTERLAVAGRTSAEVADRLAQGAGVVRGRPPTDGPAPAVFLFPGQGAQHPGMAVPFTQALPGFSAALEVCLGAFGPVVAARLRRALLEVEFSAQELRETELAQPALFAIEYAAATALSALGLAPAVLAGHSLGEITAACVAGVFDLRDAARFVTARGRAMQACPSGAMLGLGCGEAEARELVAEYGGGLDLAAVNAADSSVVAGTAESVEGFQSWLGDRVFAQQLRTSRAFHSALIESALPSLASELSSIRLRRPALPFAANTTGRIIPAGADIRPEMFVEQARRTVRFAEAMSSIAERWPGVVVVEVGPGRVLSAMAGAMGLTAVALSPARTAGVGGDLLTALGRLWTLGQPIAATALCGPGQRIHLPGYPFAGARWIAPEAAPHAAPRDADDLVRDAAAVEQAPARDASGLLTSLWGELLGRADLTDDSDFFQLGGDSLLITSLARKVNQEFGIQVPLRAMLAGRTLGRQTTIVLGLLGQSPAPLLSARSGSSGSSPDR
jgi:phthiocerol/phenolphthiocerol synthesis type-I polyketide synthase E